MNLLTKMFWSSGELCNLLWENIHPLQVLLGELGCLLWKWSKQKVQHSLNQTVQPRINLYLIQVDSDFFHFPFYSTELNTRECASSCIYDIQISYQS